MKLNKMRHIYINAVRVSALLIFVSILWSCSSQKQLSRNVKRMIEKSDTLSKYQVGFALYEPESRKYLYSKDLHKYYTPASNTKIYTLYGALKMLPERVNALRYIKRNDSLIFWGTGDPSFFQAKLKGTAAYDFLKASKEKLFYAPTRYTSHFYGAGWQWDDYNDYYQPEVGEFPIMDNMVTVKISQNEVSISPKMFRSHFNTDSALTTAFKVIRDFDSNRFTVPNTALPQSYNQQIPYKTSPQITIKLLTDTLGKEVEILNLEMPSDAKALLGLQRDSILKEMMLPSDNFIAEHLLLLGADQLGKELNTSKTIAHILKTYLPDLPDRAIWVDGSGLSRYNLFTPADNVFVLNKLLEMYPDREKLFKLFPAGGHSGTLRTTYPKTDKPLYLEKQVPYLTHTIRAVILRLRVEKF